MDVSDFETVKHLSQPGASPLDLGADFGQVKLYAQYPNNGFGSATYATNNWVTRPGPPDLTNPNTYEGQQAAANRQPAPPKPRLGLRDRAARYLSTIENLYDATTNPLSPLVMPKRRSSYQFDASKITLPTSGPVNYGDKTLRGIHNQIMGAGSPDTIPNPMKPLFWYERRAARKLTDLRERIGNLAITANIIEENINQPPQTRAENRSLDRADRMRKKAQRLENRARRIAGVNGMASLPVKIAQKIR